MARQIQSQVIQEPQQQDQGNPFLNLLGTYLPMAFGLPPIPALGQVMSGKMPSLGGVMGTLGNFGMMPGMGGSNPWMPTGINPNPQGPLQQGTGAGQYGNGKNALQSQYPWFGIPSPNDDPSSFLGGWF